jgi:hypothetical protein
LPPRDLKCVASTTSAVTALQPQRNSSNRGQRKRRCTAAAAHPTSFPRASPPIDQWAVFRNGATPGSPPQRSPHAPTHLGHPSSQCTRTSVGQPRGTHRVRLGGRWTVRPAQQHITPTRSHPHTHAQPPLTARSVPCIDVGSLSTRSSNHSCGFIQMPRF